MVNFTIKGIPDDLYAGLKGRAAQNRRSINSELLVCLEQTGADRRRGCPVNSSIDRLAVSLARVFPCVETPARPRRVNAPRLVLKDESDRSSSGRVPKGPSPGFNPGKHKEIP